MLQSPHYPYKISTMTYVCRFAEIVDTKAFYEAYVGKEIDADFYIENKMTKINKKGVLVKSFGNQITIKSNIKNYNIKLFSNGKIQITGIKHPEDALHIESRLSDIFKTRIVDMEMVMMNVTFKISSKPIHLYNLYDVLLERELLVHYTPEIYPGLKLKFNRSTALLFATGSIIISTRLSKDIEDITALLDSLIKLLSDDHSL